MNLTCTSVAFKRISAVLLVAAILLSIAFSYNWVKAADVGTRPAERTKEEIIKFFDDYPSYIETNYRPDEAVYKERFSASAPYKAGVLNDSVYTNYLNAVNEIRFVAGLNPVSLSNEYNQKAQAACLVNTVNNTLYYNPTKPADMDQALYDLGYEGAMNSNLLYNYNGPAAAVYMGWGYDNDSDELRNRRWILNPYMDKTGYGEVGLIQAMYVTDGMNKASSFTGLAYPAKYMPWSLFYDDMSWLYSVGRKITDSEINSLKVTIKHDQSSKTWEMSKSLGNLTVSNANYGLTGAIIFYPKDFMEPDWGDSYTVTITGLQDGTITYTVECFDAEDLPDSDTKDEPTPSTPDEPSPSEPDVPTPVTPDEPTPSNSDTPTPTPAPITKQNGLADAAASDGNWYYYKDGKIDTTHNGVDQNKYGWWRVENGKVNFNAQGIYQNGFGWWKTTNGRVTFKEEGVFQNGFGWWRVKDSKFDFSANGIYQNQHGWWKTTNGKVTFKENGVFQNENGWWYVKNSQVDFKYFGIASNQNGSWFIRNGKVDFSKSGVVEISGHVYTLKDGKVVKP